MTPAQHYAAAEAFLLEAPSPDVNSYTTIDAAISLNALAHAVLALAGELGVPTGSIHVPAAPQGGTETASSSQTS